MTFLAVTHFHGPCSCFTMRVCWAWPVKVMRTLQAWSQPRDVWMRAVLTFRGIVGH